MLYHAAYVEKLRQFYPMKKAILFGSALSLMLVGMSFESIERVEKVYNRTAAPAGHSGSPNDGKNCTACHLGTSEAKTNIITSDIPANGYVPGSTYTITVTLNNTGTTRFGFQLSPQNNAGAMLGTWGPNTTETQVIASKYATHKLIGTNGTDMKTWNLQWTAPAAGTGDVTFYGAFNISNADNNTTGDKIWTSSMTVAEQGGNSLKAAGVMLMKAFISGNDLAIEWNEASNESAIVSLIDMQGKAVATWNIEDRLTSFRSALPSLEAGVYLVRVDSEGIRGSQKVLIY